MSEHETIADIIAEMRNDANADEYTPDGILGQTLNCLADCIAVCLRAIDVIEGRQKLGKPETKGETK